ncbi:hypothetical protein ONS96_004965 [Cadophora gregata f. sp. sojae]|nr:hypothetical protein ONS96_004965 [Cadophora gregata f. sp. sojae]
MPNQSNLTRHPMYIDYSKDTIFISRYTQDQLRDVLLGYYQAVRFTNWRLKVRNLAMSLAVLKKSRYSRVALFPGPEPADPNGYEEATRYLANVIRMFPKLHDLSFVIDGRNPGFGGNVEIVEASSEHEDYDVVGGRDLASAWIPQVFENLKTVLSDGKIPSVRVALLINGRDTPNLERRWSYLRIRCGVCHPDGADPEPEPPSQRSGIAASRYWYPGNDLSTSESESSEDGSAVAGEGEDGPSGPGSDSKTDADNHGSSTPVKRNFICRFDNPSSSDDEEDGPSFAFPSLQNERSSHFRATLL